MVRKKDRVRFPERPGSGEIAYHFESLDFKANERKLNAFLAEFEQVAAEKVPLGRSGLKVEIAKLAVFLCSEDAAYIVGQTIVADGGVTIAGRG